MKLLVTPWNEIEVVEMDELYQELTLEKVENKPTGQKGITLRSYTELFDAAHVQVSAAVEGSSNEDSPKPPQNPKLDLNARKGKGCKKGKRVQGKGDPGMGKTTLAKKMAWDWAKEKFTTFSLVLFVMLKLAQPGDRIESVIFDQNKWIEGLNVSEKALRKVLKTFGSRCLLILDGYDEIANQVNNDVMKIIEGRKLFTCNVVLTSRPHETKAIEQRFGTVFKVNGFSRERAYNFAWNILKEEGKVKAVLNFSPYREPLYQCPILLAFICVLVRDGDESLDLTDERIDVGSVYLLMTQFLYKKYVTRKGAQYEHEGFLQMMKSIGKIAWEMLLSGNFFRRRGDLVREVGEDVFAIGLLIGDENIRSTRNIITADILITFPHRSLQEFLASGFFILSLQEGCSIEELLGPNCEKPPFMANPLFLKFCLFFLNGAQDTVGIKNKDSVVERLTDFVSKRIDRPQLHLRDIRALYPALDLMKPQDEAHSEFFSQILESLINTQELDLEQHIPDFLVKFAQSRVNKLRRFNYEVPILNVPATKADELLLALGNGSIMYVADALVQAAAECGRQVHLYLDITTCDSISAQSAQVLRSLTITRKSTSPRYGALRQEFPHLTHLTLKEPVVEEYLVEELVAANDAGYFPKLTHLSFKGSGAKGRLSRLFTCRWPVLTHFTFRHQLCPVEAEVKALASAVRTSFFPCLTSVDFAYAVLDYVRADGAFESLTEIGVGCLSERMRDEIQDLKRFDFLSGLPRLQNVRINNVLFCQFKALMDRLPLNQLRELDLSPDVSGQLRVLCGERLPTLQTLILRDCRLKSEDLLSLSEAEARGDLPNLHHLDITRHRGDLHSLFREGNKWNQLHILKAYPNYTKHSPRDFKVLCSCASQGGLRSLRELDLPFSHVSVKPNPDLFPCLQVISFEGRGSEQSEADLVMIQDLIKDGYFPALNTVIFCNREIVREEIQRLRQNHPGLKVYRR